MAVRSATGDVQFKAQATIRNTLSDGTIASATIGGQLEQLSLTDGVSANEFNRAWFQKSISITSGSFKDFDLTSMSAEDIGAGNGKDAVGLALDVEEIVCLVIKNASTTTGILAIQDTVPAAANVAWVPENFASPDTNGGIRPNGFRVWYEPSTNGLDVLSGSSSSLRLSATVDDVIAEIYVMARHDDDESSSSSTSSSSTSSSSS